MSEEISHGGPDSTAFGSRRDVGVLPGLSPYEVEMRSAFAEVLADARFPATPRQLSAHALRHGTPGVAIRTIEGLPDRPYDRLSEVMNALAP